MVRTRWVLALLAALAGGCATNPSGGTMEDGRIYVTVNMPVGLGRGYLLRITTWVEGYEEPFVTELFDYRQEASALRQNIDFEGALDWSEHDNKPLDVVGLMVPGGTEVRIKASDYDIYLLTQELTFRVDGNVGLRVYAVPPDNKAYQIERLY